MRIPARLRWPPPYLRLAGRRGDPPPQNRHSPFYPIRLQPGVETRPTIPMNRARTIRQTMCAASHRGEKTMFDFESVLLRVAAACFASAILAQSVQAASPAAGKRPSAGREAPAAPQPPAKASTRPGDKAAAEDEASASAAPAAAPGGKQGERWRYRYHQGRWWYWLPAERWVVWDGNEWEAYHPFVIVPESAPLGTITRAARGLIGAALKNWI